MSPEGVLARQVRQVCNRHGVSVTTFVIYHNFALQVAKTRKHAQGRDLQLVVGALVGRYVGLGLERQVLEDVAYIVFTIKPVGTSDGHRQSADG